MTYLIGLKASRAVWLAASAVAAAAVAAGTAGTAATPGNAAPAGKAAQASYPSGKARFKRPTLRHGVLTVRGTEASEAIALRLEGGDAARLEVDVGDDGTADFRFKRKKIATILVVARGGNDLVRIDEANGVFTDAIATTIDGEAGNDNLLGGAGAETLLGGDGNDSIDGNGGTDRGLMGSGDDVFVWDPGDGSDTVEGQRGNDTMRFNGANAAERVDLSANGRRLRFFRDPGAITMDTAGVERVEFNGLGGADLVTVDDLTGTDVAEVAVDLAATLGGTAGDGQVDRLVARGTGGDDAIDVSGGVGEVKVSGLAATIRILHAEAASDRLELETLAGADTVDAGALAAGAIQLVVDGVLVP